jgi:DNA mismatch endonuclease (patch repair protein)
MPNNNYEFWQEKLADNVSRDSKNISDLKKLGWSVFVVWTCEIKNLQLLAENLNAYLQSKGKYRFC